MPDLAPLLTILGETSASLTPDVARSWADADLIATQAALADARRRLETTAAVVAGEIAHRSRRELGHSGLAATRGVRTAEELIATVSGTSRRAARTLVKAAELLSVAASPAGDTSGDAGSETEARTDAASRPRWLAVLGEAVGSARLSAEQAEVIRVRLGAVTAAGELSAAGAKGDSTRLAPEQRDALDASLTAAAERLIAAAAGLTIEQLAVRASRARDDLDVAGIAARERQLHEKRYLRLIPQTDGSTRLDGLLDPESAAVLVPIADAATSPRRGGPRFVDPDAQQRAEDIVRDTRTTEQLTLDTFVELIRMGAHIDDGKLLGEKKPTVRILVTKNDLEARRTEEGNRAGAAFFEGQSEAISIETAERHICSSGAIPILFDGDGRVLNLGREQRLFSERQRVAMAARDGGCLMCDRPPSWSEAHHIDHWEEHRGETNIDDGVLLCRHCHLLLHNRNWRIRRDGGAYSLERPDEDGILRRTPLPSRSRALDRLRATA
jgi:hypothetical protein